MPSVLVRRLKVRVVLLWLRRGRVRLSLVGVGKHPLRSIESRSLSPMGVKGVESFKTHLQSNLRSQETKSLLSILNGGIRVYNFRDEEGSRFFSYVHSSQKKGEKPCDGEGR